MPIAHNARHLKAALAAASEDPNRLHLQQVRVTEELVEGTDGMWLLRIERESPKSKVASTVSTNSLKTALGVSCVRSVEIGERLIAKDDRDNEVLSVPTTSMGPYPPTDMVMPKTLDGCRTFCMDPRLFAKALTSIVAAGIYIGKGVRISVPSDPTAPIVIKAEGDEAYITAVVMPMKAAD